MLPDKEKLPQTPRVQISPATSTPISPQNSSSITSRIPAFPQLTDVLKNRIHTTMPPPSHQQPPSHNHAATTATATQTLTSTPVLRLRATAPPPQNSRRRIQWAEDVVDNEGLGRKRSKGPYHNVPAPHPPPLSVTLCPNTRKM